MPFDPSWERFDGARWMREHYAEMDRIAERFRDPGREFREMQANLRKQFEEMRDPMRGLRETYDQIRQRLGYREPVLAPREPARIIRPEPTLLVIEGGLATKPRRGRPAGYVTALSRSATTAADFFFGALDLASKGDPAARVMFEDTGLVDDPPQSVLGISRAVADFACKYGLPDSEALDPNGHTLKAIVQAKLTARELLAAAMAGKAAD